MTDIDIIQHPHTVLAFDGSQQRAIVFLDRYAQKGADGQPIESLPDEMWGRVSRAIAANPQQQAEFYRILDGFRFVPGGRILSGAGSDTEVTYYNCVAGGTLVHTDDGVVPIESLVGQTVYIKTVDGVYGSRPRADGARR